MTRHARIEAFDRGMDRRSTQRQLLRLPVQGATTEQIRIDALIQDLSTTGLLIESDAELPDGARLALELPQIGTVEAAVVWGTGRYYGARFDSPLDASALSAAQLKGSVGRRAVRVAHAQGELAPVLIAPTDRPNYLLIALMGGLALATWAAIIAPIIFI